MSIDLTPTQHNAMNIALYGPGIVVFIRGKVGNPLLKKIFNFT